MALVGALAYPGLQLFIKGSVYEEATETWTVEDNVFGIWIIGDVANVGKIFEVKLAAVFWGESDTFTLTPKATNLVLDPLYLMYIWIYR